MIKIDREMKRWDIDTLNVFKQLFDKSNRYKILYLFFYEDFRIDENIINCKISRLALRKRFNIFQIYRSRLILDYIYISRLQFHEYLEIAYRDSRWDFSKIDLILINK